MAFVRGGAGLTVAETSGLAWLLRMYWLYHATPFGVNYKNAPEDDRPLEGGYCQGVREYNASRLYSSLGIGITTNHCAFLRSVSVVVNLSAAHYI